MDQTPRRDVQFREASQTLHAPVIVPTGAAAVQQQSLVAQAAEAAGIAH
jgi:hypothetical protein